MESKVNTMYLDFAKKFSLQIQDINVDVQKINSFKLDTFGIVIASFSVEDKKKRSCFFEGIFLLADISMDITLRMLFHILSIVDMDFICRYV